LRDAFYYEEDLKGNVEKVEILSEEGFVIKEQ
jgi:hypothetical protein